MWKRITETKINSGQQILNMESQDSRVSEEILSKSKFLPKKTHICRQKISLNPR